MVVVAGSFYAAGNTLANNIATYDPNTRQFAPLGSGTNGPIVALTVGPNNELIVGGTFLLAGGVLCSRVASWNGAQWQPLAQGVSTPGLLASVSALATLANGDIVALGRFSTAGTAPAGNVARWDGSTWSAMGSLGATGAALLAHPNGDLIAGLGGTAGSGVMRWTGAAWVSMAAVVIAVPSLPLGYAGYVNRLAALANGDLVIGGNFTQLVVNGITIPAANIARWNGVNWLPLGSGTDGQVAALHVRNNGELLVGGNFGNAGGSGALGVATWSAGAWGTLGAGANLPNVIDLIELANGDLLAAGDFNGGPPNPGISRLRRWDGTAWGETNPTGLNGEVSRITPLRDGTMVVTGAFTSANGAPVSGIARGTIGNWQAIGPALDGPAYAVAEMPNGDLVVGGAFTQAGTTAASNIARWNGTAWLPLGGGCNSWVTQVTALPNGDVLATGSFTAAGGVPANSIARWDGTAWQPLGGGLPTGDCRHVVAANGEVFAGFSVLGGTWYISSFWRWNGLTWQTFANDLSGPLASLRILPSGELLAAGPLAQGASYGVFRWDGVAWNSFGNGVQGYVNDALPLPGGKLLVGGGALMEWDGGTWTEQPINSFHGLPTVTGLARAADGSVFAVGNFTTVGAVTTSHVARAQSSCPASTTVLGPGCPGSSGTPTLVGDLAWLGSTWRADAAGLPAPSLVLLVFGLSPANVPLASTFPVATPSCTLRVSNDFLDFAVTGSGTVSAQLTIPSTAALVGASLYHQMVPLEFNALGAITLASVTPALSVTIGAY